MLLVHNTSSDNIGTMNNSKYLFLNLIFVLVKVNPVKYMLIGKKQVPI